ncbi:MAG TPA: hypothetical protein VFS49_08500 [Croceibacterium sp.]|nr:hypothetical protein [Croceibacterium sp.]
MFAHRATILAAAAASLFLAGTPAAAQMDQATAVNILRECARIDDASARLACYDNNIRNVGGTPRSSVPGQMPVVQGGSAPIPPGAAGAVAANTPRGFGAEDVRTPERFATPSTQLQEITARIRAIRPREPGVYAFTLEDGAEWLFAESVGRDYRVPRAGAEIGIERGALGSYLMRFDDQSPVSVRRIR